MSGLRRAKIRQAKRRTRESDERRRITDPLIAEIRKSFNAWHEGMRDVRGGLPLSMLKDSEYWRQFDEFVEFAKSEVELKRYIALMEKLMKAAITQLEIRELRQILSAEAETVEGAKRTLVESIDSAEEKLGEK